VEAELMHSEKKSGEKFLRTAKVLFQLFLSYLDDKEQNITAAGIRNSPGKPGLIWE
jgi:hypothetical protein